MRQYLDLKKMVPSWCDLLIYVLSQVSGDSDSTLALYVELNVCYTRFGHSFSLLHVARTGRCNCVPTYLIDVI